MDSNPSQGDNNGEGLEHVRNPDRDGDIVANGTGNCFDVSNPGRQDTDLDGIGEACDLA